MTKERLAHLRELSRTNPVPSLLAFRECLDEIERLQEALAHYRNSPPPHPPSEREDLERKYYELLFAVARVFHGETLHQTALRYILETEGRAAMEAAPARCKKPDSAP